MRRIGVAALWVAWCVWLTLPAAAQDNLLTNGGLEQGEFGPYTGRGRGDLNVPVGWNIWLGQGPQDQFLNRGDKTFSFPHGGPDPNPVEGSTAANLSGGFVQFNAAYFQQVADVDEGTPLRAEAASQVKACDLNGGSNCGSSPVSGARTRIGIDPDGGDNPNAPEIVWSSWVEPHDQWLRQSVEATATGDSVTVFLFATQDRPAELNRAYWDDVSLRAAGDGGSADADSDADNNTANSPPPTAQQFVPFVNAQGAQADGSVMHTVAEGDTLLSIAVAYGVSATRITELNPELGDARSLRVGQQLLIEPAAERPPATSTPETAAAPTDIPGDAAPNTIEVENALPPADQDTDDDTPRNNIDASAVIGEFAGLLRTNTPAGDNTDGGDNTDDSETAAGAIATSTPQPDTDDAPPEPTSPPQVDFTASTASVCVSLFDDVNENRLQEQGESLLANGQIVLNDTDGNPVTEYTTDGQSEPHCFNELMPGEYIAVVTPPTGYGLTTPNRLRLPLTSGTSLNIEFGAAEGVEVAAADVPEGDTDTSPSETTEDAPADDASGGPVMDFITENIVLVGGALVAALLAVVLVAGAGATILLRRAN